MKICAVIAEYNPFHLGHKKQFDFIKNTLCADKIIVVMSGNFTQRGEPAVLDKYTRAKHAILAGADMVIELPTVFATANAEIFAKGATTIIDKLNVVDELCFGVESGEKQDFVLLAQAMNNESKEFKKILKEQLDKGVSLAKAKFEAVKKTSQGNFDNSLVSLPNNILGVEYTKALLSLNSAIEISPMLREGDHRDKTLKKGITSATSIRSTLKSGKKSAVKSNVPTYVYKDLNGYPTLLEGLIVADAIKRSASQIERVPDCTEGLENRIKALVKDNKDLDELVEKITTKRYTETRIRRILLSNFLGIDKKTAPAVLKDGLYAKILAVKKQSKDLISLLCDSADIPILTRKSDVLKLDTHARESYEIDTCANDLYSLATAQNINENLMLIIE